MIGCYLFAVVQQHDVIISQVVLTEVRALLRHREITLLIRTPERKRNEQQGNEQRTEKSDMRRGTQMKSKKEETDQITYLFRIPHTFCDFLTVKYLLVKQQMMFTHLKRRACFI